MHHFVSLRTLTAFLTSLGIVDVLTDPITGAQALLSYVSHNHADVGAMFDLLPAFDIRTRLDFNFLRAFFTTQARRALSYV